MTQGTFRSVVRPKKITVNTDFAGALDFTGRATSFNFTSGQSLPFTSVTETNHLIVGQMVEFVNGTTSDIFIDGTLMEDGMTIDIEPDKTSILIWTSNNKFYDAGGTAYTKNVEDTVTQNRTDFDAHDHDGVNSPKIEGTNLASTGASIGDILTINSGGSPEWRDPFDGIQPDLAVWNNSDTTTDINTATWTQVPIGGTQYRTPTTGNLTMVADGIQANFDGWVKVKFNIHMFSTGQRVALQFRITKDGNPMPGIASSGYIRNSSGHQEATCYMERHIPVLSGEIIRLEGQRESTTTSACTMFGTNSFLEVEITPTVAARGPDGEPGYSGWEWLDGSVDPVVGQGVDGDVYLNTTSGDFFRKISGTWTFRTNLIGPVGPPGETDMMLWAEENGGLSDNGNQWSFGNGSTSNGAASFGVCMPKAGQVEILTLAGETAGTGTTTVELLNNGVASGKSVTTAANIASGVNDFTGTPYAFAAGDVLTFRTVLGGGMSDARVGAYIKFT